MSGILIDTGPIVAILSSADNHHKICVETLKKLSPPLLTTWPVITESQYLLRKNKKALQGLFHAFSGGLFALEELPSESLPWLENFLTKYEDINSQIADASLMYVAEQKNIDTIFTLDRRDFFI
ncbi:PIN domain-containing protein [Trichormus sp. NMC-1]|uniref:type II toxin-antitoxin system VapC family toxin n=1 Tax=Trichormus sp. NMC-1 TaxID=1853259 RepID=UPI0008DC09B7|nr:PIN domain-containing protein [Trichormus sp. NMC-1]